MKKSLPKNWIPAFAGMTILFLFSFWLMFHTFGYDQKNHSILMASRLWSDFGANIPLIRSFSMGNNLDRMLTLRPPDYPIFAGEPIRKHFLFYAFVGLLEKLGMRIDWALNIPSALGFFALLLGIYVLSQKLFRSVSISVLSILFFLFNGSLSFLRFFTDHPLSKNTLRDVTSIREFPSFAPWGPGDITAFWNLNIYTNQRHLAAGFAIGIWFLVWIVQTKKNIMAAILWGLALGILPYFHQPMLLIVAILLVSCFIFFPADRRFILTTGFIGLLFVIPQIMLMPKSESLGWYPGYLIHDQLTIPRFLWYWLQNLGPHAILIPVGFLFIPNVAKRTLAPLFIIFLAANLFRFSVEVAASHKFFNFALILGAMISAFVVVSLRTKLKGIISMLLIGMLIFSGIIDFFVIRNDGKGAITDAPADERAMWIAQHTPKEAIFLNSSYLYHPASLAGRSIFLGWPYFPWSEGYKGDRMKIAKTLYESKNPKIFCPILNQYHISYITVEEVKNDPNMPTIDLSYFQKTFQPVFTSQDSNYSIFRAIDLCPSSS